MKIILTILLFFTFSLSAYAIPYEVEQKVNTLKDYVNAKEFQEWDFVGAIKKILGMNDDKKNNQPLTPQQIEQQRQQKIQAQQQAANKAGYAMYMFFTIILFIGLIGFLVIVWLYFRSR